MSPPFGSGLNVELASPTEHGGSRDGPGISLGLRGLDPLGLFSREAAQLLCKLSSARLPEGEGPHRPETGQLSWGLLSLVSPPDNLAAEQTCVK